MREFETGATRSDDSYKNDYEGFYSPLVVEAFGNYMTKHRTQADGKMRDSDNWQKGINRQAYMKSFWRHMMDLWKLHRGCKAISVEDSHEITIEEACCAILFNVQGYLFEVLMGR